MAYIYETADGACYDLLSAYADYNKSHPTEAESIVWEILKSKNIDGHKFRRQHIIKDYIVDFVCLQKKIVIEIDGQYHLENQQIVKDKSRTEDLQRDGYSVIRFTNEEVIANTSEVVRNIKKALMEIISSKGNNTAPKSPLPLEGDRGRLEGLGIDLNAWAVDAACSGNPGPMEYQAIDLQTGARVFHFGPMKGTNNIGEFLAIVHALALMQQQGLHDKAIYSDSYNAILWVNKRKCKTKLERTPETEPLYQIILRAERWLNTHTWRNPIIKWETQKWGEVPADFGRK
jgi:very-short-patch-repair endonuclease/ribonuclease HI